MKMNVILRQDVENVGEAGTLQTVSGGFARNYLIPKGLAIVATSGELKVLAENQRVKDRKIARQERELQSLADRLSGQRLTFEARAGDQGRLYGSITAGDIAEKLTAAVGQEIDRRKVVLDEAIRSVGEHTVSVHLVGKLRPQVTVVVTAIADAEEEATASE
ncbi:MAG: large subunit ribosomal protein [Thermomicrobiales bacterium]|jgi:large subunit ribosomal protein L9|nr:large subunit ribosomal protein [Thermomicrobiales bacterium]MEA2524416.1 large subunit ribosomal protein [Thermomicrobiales bacterium]MEA2586321.1 large subunit ribosomal protein [Thermomicrobiales bacterium]MEA2598386.1 large subunit ribosomal protein [Thermomicrobiales bacterium]